MPAQPETLYYLAPAPDPANVPHRIAYYSWGDKHNPRKLVCVHGLSRNGRDFDYLATEMMKDYHVLSIDMPGRGKSEWLTDKLHYNYGQYLSDLLNWMAAVGITKCDWVGTSMGGILGMMLATMHPDRIGKLVLNDIGMTISAVGMRRIIDYMGALPSFASRDEAMEYFRTIFAPFGIHREEHWQHLLNYSLREREDGKFAFSFDPAITESFREQTNDFRDIQDIDLKPFWENIRIPVLILRGKESDLLTHDTAESMKTDKPLVSLVEIEGIGHAPPLLEEDQIRIVAEWLRKANN